MSWRGWPIIYKAEVAGLKSGDIITTGTACDIYNAEAGDEIVADYGSLGSVALSFV